MKKFPACEKRELFFAQKPFQIHCALEKWEALWQTNEMNM